MDKKINKGQLSVLLISDFFYPKVGGVEVHIYQLAVSLIRLGCKVTVLTHHRRNRQGIKYMGNGIKVYFTPLMTLYDDTSIPYLYGSLKILREICYTEKIDIIHCHQSTSCLSLECIFHSKMLGVNAVTSEHSLYGFSFLYEGSLNKVIRTFYVDIDEAISVSHVATENLILRGMINPKIVHTIPNGIDNTKFRPPSEKELKEMRKIKLKEGKEDIITIVSVSRQAERKGTDLLIEVIPEICKQLPNVNFIIGGDGPKKKLLDVMVDAIGLKDRVKLTGFLQHQKVRDVMIQGQIYLNTSLTESFCIAIVEAASAGLYTIATDVGGVGEVLPEYMVKLVKPNKESIIKAIKDTIKNYDKLKEKIKDNYKVLKSIYNWDKVAKKTKLVYQRALKKTDMSFITRIKKIFTVGHMSPIIYLCAVLLDFLFLFLFTVFQPLKSIKTSKKEFKYKNYVKFLRNKKKIKENNKNNINNNSQNG
jgi:phosphatidylinositol glycan class A protein